MEEEIKEKIIKQAKDMVHNGEIKSNTDADNFLYHLIQPLYQEMLNAELDNLLNYKKYEHNKNDDNSRNGFCKNKSVQTKYGNITIKTPRDRNGELNPIIIPKGENRLGQFEDIILSLCTKRMSYRDISDILKKIYGINISKDQINNFVNTINKVVD